MITSKTKIKINLVSTQLFEGNLLALTEQQTLDHEKFDMTDSIHSVQFASPWMMRLAGLFPHYEQSIFPTGQPQLTVCNWKGQFLSMGIDRQTGMFKISYNSLPAEALSELNLIVNRENLNRRAVVKPIPRWINWFGRVFG